MTQIFQQDQNATSQVRRMIRSGKFGLAENHVALLLHNVSRVPCDEKVFQLAIVPFQESNT